MSHEHFYVSCINASSDGEVNFLTGIYFVFCEPTRRNETANWMNVEFIAIFYHVLQNWFEDIIIYWLKIDDLKAVVKNMKEITYRKLHFQVEKVSQRKVAVKWNETCL